ncbi:hypothetical protein ASF10_11865 [Flavobacterium sp. Leaf82]|uniref:DUF6934 family protein n=1 Tax=unclassified Flavobacterium TaxID=196869 RepID=UPI0006FCC307|nr:hypothetical protein [Flavobacterium sp. Leaf82]KQO21448.1 hypothetical protein ASF10_11865 [Flavobacterium sp. Leaf82]
MNLNSYTYNLSESKDENNNYLRYYFISEGKESIIKVIDYQYVQEYEEHDIYNLAFGNYDAEKDIVVDDANSNNGDVYPVFNTVLLSITAFFEIFPNDKIIVQGSDGTQDFLEKCKENCIKNCKDNKCRKFNQRLKIYKGYVDKNYDILIKEYKFYGGFKDEFQNSYLEDYVKNKEYFSVVVEKI